MASVFVAPCAIAQKPVVFQRDIQPVLAKRCFTCHGPDEEQRAAGLRLDREAAAHGAGARGVQAIVPGDHTASEVYRRITETNPNRVMPPPEAGPPLRAEETAKIAAWIDAGAAYEAHWAFVKPERPVLPEVSDAAWPRQPLDHFVLARLEAAGVKPAPEAAPATLLRRVHLDLSGLPPAPEEVQAFLADPRPDAYERVVEALLDSPHYGERWGRHWLDIARYADSNGYSIDGPRNIWKYRDWVINALNRDLPFDRFVIEQIAGDLLPEATLEQQIATGFHRNTLINQEGGVDPEEFRIRAVVDRVNTTATAFLGLTMACAECHTHKYDPITINEYYRMFAFFNSDDEVDLELPTPEQEAALAEANAAVAAASRAVEDYWAAQRVRVTLEWAEGLPEEVRTALTPEVRLALADEPASRSGPQERHARNLFFQHDEEAKRVNTALAEARKLLPDVVRTMVLRQGKGRPTHVLLAGDFTRPGELVTPGVPEALHRIEGDAAPNRLDLARWLVSPENPLTARVTVNRYWQRLFGKGLVATENDFGIQGALPTHPELLDWLAVEFMAGWRVKDLHRQLVTSATYRQASHAREDLRERDPLNLLLARQNRLRLDAEIIRDAALTVSGLLSRDIGGPGVFPPQPEGVMSLGQVNRPWTTSEGPERFRRGLYTYFWRATPYHPLSVFDAPDATVSCTRRNRSNTPLQALTLLNDPAYVELAQGLARRVIRAAPPDDTVRLHVAFELCNGRGPSARELSILQELLAQERASLAGDAPASALIAAADFGHGVPLSEVAAWTAVARTLMNTDEFITRE